MPGGKQLAAPARLPGARDKIAQIFLAFPRYNRLARDVGTICQYALDLKDLDSAPLTALEMMTLVLEDRRFFDHSGVDVRAVAREVFKMLTGRRHGGASTIDMQFVRTATQYRAPTFRRKIYEAFLAMIIQYRFSKLTILRSYLACAYFGSGLTGANLAAQKMFGKSADSLSMKEGSILAAMLACPRPMHGPQAWQERMTSRAEYGMSVLNDGGTHLAALCHHVTSATPHVLAAE